MARKKQIGEIMTRSVETVRPGATVRDAASLMKKDDIGAVPVAEGGMIKGMLTDRDIAIRLVAEGKDCNATLVSDIMTPGIVSCAPEDSIQDVENLMERKKIRRIVVVGPEGKPLGIVSLGDIAVHLGKQEGGEVLEQVSEPVHSRVRM